MARYKLIRKSKRSELLINFDVVQIMEAFVNE